MEEVGISIGFGLSEDGKGLPGGGESDGGVVDDLGGRKRGLGRCRQRGGGGRIFAEIGDAFLEIEPLEVAEVDIAGAGGDAFFEREGGLGEVAGAEGVGGGVDIEDVMGLVAAPAFLAQAAGDGFGDGALLLDLHERGLGVGGVALGDVGLAGGGDDADDERKENQHGCGDEDLVALGELAELVKGGGAAGGDGLIGEVAADVGGEVAGRLVTARFFFFDGLGDDELDVAAKGFVDGRQAAGFFGLDDADGGEDGAVGEIVGELAGEEFVGDDAESVDVGAGVDLVGVAGGLFGGHVGEGAKDGADFGVHGGELDVGIVGDGETEVEDLGMRGIVGIGGGHDEDVGGLEVAVDDAFWVGIVDGVSDLGEELEPVLEREVVGGRVFDEGLAFDELHGEVRLNAVGSGGGAGLVDGGDAGMLEAGEDFGFALEAAEGGGSDGGDADDFECDGAAGAELMGAVDHAHAAFAEA